MSEIQKKLPDRWKCVRLGDVCEFIGGMQPPKYTFKYSPEPGYIRLVQIQDFRRSDAAVYIPEEEGKRRFSEEDVMIGRYGPPVFQILRGLSGSYNVALMKAVPKEDVMKKDFLYYLLQEPGIQNAVIAQSQRSAGQSGVQKEFIENFIVSIPPIEEQKQIASILKEQFVEVEKLRASAMEQLETVKGLTDAYIREAFNNENLEEWNEYKLGDICTQDRVILDPNSDIAKNLTYISLEHVESGSGRILREPSETITDEGKSTTFAFSSYHVLYGKLRPYLNKVATPNFKGRCTTEMIPLKPTNIVKREFLAYILRRPETVHFAMQDKTGSRMPRADLDELLKLIVKIPALSRQEEICNVLNERLIDVQQMSKVLEEQLIVINQLTKAILRKVFSEQK